MSAHLFAQLLAGLAMVIVNIGAVSQALAVIKGRTAANGVSLAAAGVIVVSCTAWVVYSSAQALVLSAVSSVCGLAVWAVVTVAVARQRRSVRELLTPAIFALVLLGCWLLAGAAGLGAALVAEVVLTSVPQLWRVHRHGAQGVSILAWASITFAGGCWFVYGVVFADLVMMGSQGIRFLGAAAVTVAVVSSGGSAARSRGDCERTKSPPWGGLLVPKAGAARGSGITISRTPRTR